MPVAVLDAASRREYQESAILSLQWPQRQWSCRGPKGSGAAVAPKAVGLPWPQRQLANWFGGSRRNLWTALRAFTVISKDKISELDPEDKNVADTQLELTQLLQEGLNCVSYVGCQEPTATAGLCCAMTY